MSSNFTILLTGASGVVGQALLSSFSTENVICLVRRVPVTGLNITAVPSDISLPTLGLEQKQWQDIASRIDCIVHSAAVTGFSEDDELVQRTNVTGIKNILELTAAAGVPLYYISTAFLYPPQEDDHAYAASKREGERLVKESGLPATIIRPSIIIGDSRTGAIARFQGIHSVAGAILRGFLPMMPSSPDAYLDFVPQDVLAQAVTALIHEECVGEEYWITAGERAPTVRRVIELITEFAESIGRPIKPPRFVSPDIVDRLIRPAFMSALPPTVQKGFERVLQISSYLKASEPFQTSLPEIISRYTLSPLPDFEAAFVRGLEYWANKTGYAKNTLLCREAQ